MQKAGTEPRTSEGESRGVLEEQNKLGVLRILSKVGLNRGRTDKPKELTREPKATGG